MGQCTGFVPIAYAQMPRINAHVAVPNRARGIFWARVSGGSLESPSPPPPFLNIL